MELMGINEVKDFGFIDFHKIALRQGQRLLVLLFKSTPKNQARDQEPDQENDGIGHELFLLKERPESENGGYPQPHKQATVFIIGKPEIDCKK